MNSLKNPFSYANRVDKEYYLPRHRLENLVSQFLANKIHVVLVSPKGFGKSSFLMNYLEKNATSYVYVDLFDITSHKDFLDQLLQGLKRRENWKNFFKDPLAIVRPSNTKEKPIQSSSLDQIISSDKDVKEKILELLFSIENKHDLIFAVDDFQKISEVNDEGWLEETFVNTIKQRENLSFILTSLRDTVLKNHSINSCHIDLPSFGNELNDWIIERFKSVSIICTHESVEYLRKLAHDNPQEIQKICFHLVEKVKARADIHVLNEITMDEMDSVYKH